MQQFMSPPDASEHPDGRIMRAVARAANWQTTDQRYSYLVPG